MSKFEALFEGNKILGKDGEIDASSLDGKDAVFLYFSAHWCPPCKMFTPVLGEKYKALKAAGKNLECVFISADKNEGQFNEYWGSMPWAALSFENTVADKLNKKFKINGIPSLIVLDGNAEVITTNGREAVSASNYLEKFPFVPPTFREMIGDTFDSKDGAVSYDDAVKGKTLAIYFSASWCGPCKAFTPKLIETYNNLKAAEKPFEVIFASSDRDEAQFNGYYAKMPWLALPFAKREEKEMLSSHFNVRGIPTLVVVEPDGTIINAGARAAVTNDTAGAEFPWYPKAINDLSDTADGLNTHPCLILMGEEADDVTVISEVEALRPIAEAVQLKARAAKEEVSMKFFFATKSSGASGQIRNLIKTPAASTVTAAIIDIPDGGGYYLSADTAHTTESLQAFVDGYLAGSLTRIQMV